MSALLYASRARRADSYSGASITDKLLEDFYFILIAKILLKAKLVKPMRPIVFNKAMLYKLLYYYKNYDFTQTLNE